MRYLLLFALVLATILGTAQNQFDEVIIQSSLSVGTDSVAKPNAILDLDANDKGILIPKLSTGERNAITTTSQDTSLLIWNSTANEFQYYDGASWTSLSPSAINIYNSDGTSTGNRVYNYGGYTLNFSGGNLWNTGVGSTSATINFLLENSSSSQLLKVKDNGEIDLGLAGSSADVNSRGRRFNCYDASSVLRVGFNTDLNTYQFNNTSGNQVVTIKTDGSSDGVTLYESSEIFLRNTSNAITVNIRDNGADGFIDLYDSGAVGSRIIGGATSYFNREVAIGGTTANSSAILDIQSTTKGVLMPRMTSTQASAITGVDGLMVYVTDTNGTFTSVGFWGYENGAWVKL